MNHTCFWLSPEDVIPAPATLPGADVQVAVVCQLNLPDQTAETCELIQRFTRVTLETLRDLKARTELFDVTAQEPLDHDAVAAADAIVMLGGGDVDPQLYGYIGEVNNEYGTHRRSDDLQLEMLNRAFGDDVPVLTICRSMQLLNVACGGTLITDLGPDTVHNGNPGGPMFSDETVEIEAGTLLDEVFQSRKLTVRGGHHQACDLIGDDLRATAFAVDGTIEAIERTSSSWVIGVQWHPEDDAGSKEDRYRLFSALVERARLRKAERLTEPPHE